MGIEPFLISSSVLAMMAQRLVRILCPACREPVEPSSNTLRELGLTVDEYARQEGQFFQARGCPACHGTGYRGRVGIYEMMVIDDTIRSLIMQRANANTIKVAAMERGMRTLLQDGVRKILQGRTTAEEVLRVTQESE
jgi:general secretion pathway protein E